VSTAADFMAFASTLVSESSEDVARRRAVSTAYYALLHDICRRFADLAGDTLPKTAWVHAYRSLDHATAKQRCKDVLDKPDLTFSRDLKAYAAAFVRLQEARIRADYLPELFPHDARELVAEAEDVLRRIASAPTNDQRAFVLFVSLKSRTR
jgi:hypothetical protein